MEVMLTVPHDDYPAFLGRYYVGEISWVVLSHQLCVAVLIAVWMQQGMDGLHGAADWMLAVGFAVAGLGVLIPLHEGVHALALGLAGAHTIRFRVSLERGGMYAGAHHHVSGVREFIWITLAPFILLTSIFAGAIVLLPEKRFIISGMILVHTCLCAGDWAMLNVLWQGRNRELYIIDDEDQKAVHVVSPPSAP